MLTIEFRRRCENLSISYRQHLKLYAYDPLPALKLARYLKIPLVSPEQVSNLEQEYVADLLRANNWWAIGVPTNPPYILFHPYQPTTRFESSVMHELAHFILGHKPERLVTLVGNFVGRDYPKQNEKEAAYLGACLQLTIQGLDWASQQRMNIYEIAQYFGSSVKMARYRLNITGRKNTIVA